MFQNNLIAFAVILIFRNPKVDSDVEWKWKDETFSFHVRSLLQLDEATDLNAERWTYR